MFAKIILILFIGFFLLYIWNAYIENITDKSLKFYVKNISNKPRVLYDGIFFKISTIMTKKAYSDYIGDSVNEISYSDLVMGENSILEHRPILYNPEDSGDTRDFSNEPCFTIKSENSITISNVNYIPSIIDKYNIYCPVSDINISDMLKKDESNPLFKNRIACFIKADKETLATKTTDFDDLDDIILVKLIWNEIDGVYTITYFNDDKKIANAGAMTTSMGADETYLLYIYEGFDISQENISNILSTSEGTGSGSGSTALDLEHDDLYNSKCSDIIKLFESRRGGDRIPSSSSEFLTIPKYKYQKIFKHVKKLNTNNSLFSFLFGPRENIDLNNLKNSENEYIKVIQRNIKIFHKHLMEYRDNNEKSLLEYITLDLKAVGDYLENEIYQDLINIQTPIDVLRLKMAKIYSDKIYKQEDGAFSENIIFNADKIKRIAYGSRLFLRIPDYTHLCGIASKNVDILLNITIDKIDDNYVIIDSNTCVDNINITKLKGKENVKTLENNKKAVDKNGDMTYEYLLKVDERIN